MFKLTRSLSGLAALSAVVVFGFAGDCDGAGNKAAEGTTFTKDEADAAKATTKAVKAIEDKLTAAHLLNKADLEAFVKEHAKHTPTDYKVEGAKFDSAFTHGVCEVLQKHGLILADVNATTTGGYKTSDAVKNALLITEVGALFANQAGEAFKTAVAGKSLKIGTAGSTYAATKLFNLELA